MKRELLEEVVELTRTCLEHFWQKDMYMMIHYLDEDVVFVAAQQEQFQIGRKDAAAELEKIRRELQPCHLKNSEFYTASNDTRSCTIVGRYLVTTDNSAEYFLQAQQRSTFVWIKEKDEFRIKHFHVSNPIGEMKVVPGESFVNNMGRMTKQYIDNHLAELRGNRRITITRDDDAICFIDLCDIIYLEAERKNVNIYTMDDMICARTAFSDIIKKLDDKFVQVHRSYMINRGYVGRIAANQIIMANGGVIPVPAKKFSSIKNELLKDTYSSSNN